MVMPYKLRFMNWPIQRDTMLLFGAVLSASAAILFMDYHWLIRDGIRKYHSLNYSQTMGVIVASELIRKDGSEGPSSIPRVTYSYEVEGAPYTSNRLSYACGSSGCNAKDFVRNHPLGKSVTVYYDPSNPAESVLEIGLSSNDLLIAFFLLPFNGLMLVAWFGLGAMGIQWLRGQRGPDNVQAKVQVRVIRRGTRTIITLPKLSAAGIAGWTGCLAYFPMIGAVAILSALEFPAFEAIGYAGLGGLVLVVISGGWRQLRILRRDFDLWFDEEKQVLSLPQTFWRMERQEIPWSVIESFTVTTHELEDEGHKTTYYELVLHTQKVNGQTSWRLARWEDIPGGRQEAEHTAQWLRRHLVARETA